MVSAGPLALLSNYQHISDVFLLTERLLLASLIGKEDIESCWQEPEKGSTSRYVFMTIEENFGPDIC